MSKLGTLGSQTNSTVACAHAKSKMPCILHGMNEPYYKCLVLVTDNAKLMKLLDMAEEPSVNLDRGSRMLKLLDNHPDIPVGERQLAIADDPALKQELSRIHQVAVHVLLRHQPEQQSSLVVRKYSVTTDDEIETVISLDGEGSQVTARGNQRAYVKCCCSGTEALCRVSERHLAASSTQRSKRTRISRLAWLTSLRGHARL